MLLKVCHLIKHIFSKGIEYDWKCYIDYLSFYYSSLMTIDFILFLSFGFHFFLSFIGHNDTSLTIRVLQANPMLITHYICNTIFCFILWKFASLHFFSERFCFPIIKMRTTFSCLIWRNKFRFLICFYLKQQFWNGDNIHDI